MPEASRVEAAITRIAREDGGRIRGALARRFADLDLADEAVQEALITAFERWPTHGIPDNPGGWLAVTAERKALDRLRRRGSEQRRWSGAAPDVVERRYAGGERGLVVDEGGPADDRLRLLLLCCHPALGCDAQVALTLRLVGGLTTAEIARASLTSEATITQRIVRAKAKIRAAGIPLRIPADLGGRLGVVLTVLYLIFNEGYLSSRPSGPLDVELADEAIRLVRVVATTLDDEGMDHLRGPVLGLLALMLYQRSRFPARFDADGRLVRLQEQDRTTWDRRTVAEANRILTDALAADASDRFRIMAVIASLHANSPTPQATPWPLIVQAYAQLRLVDPSPIVRISEAVAVSMVDGPAAGIELLDRECGLETHHLWQAARADLLDSLGRHAEAAEGFASAARLATSEAERAEMRRRHTAAVAAREAAR